MDGLRNLRCLMSSKSSEPTFLRHPFVKCRRHFGSVDLSSPSVPNTGGPVAILWDLDNKPPNSYPPFDAATRLKKAASSFGFVHCMVAYANHHAFKHVPPFVREQRKERKTLNQLENKGVLKPAHPYLCRVCGRKFFANEKLVNHFKQIHEREHTKRLNQLESAKGKRRVQLAAKFSMKMDKYKSAARDVVTPKVGYGLADELKRAGFWVNLVSDKPQAADTALRNRMVELMDKRQVECFVLVSDDSDFINVLKEARLRCLKTVVVGDNPDGALKRCADASFSWKEIMLGKAKKEAVSVIGRWKDRNVLKRLEWTYRPELEQSKRDISDSEAENEAEEVGDIISEGGQNFLYKMSQKKLIAVFNGWRGIFFCLSIIFCLPYLFSVLDLHHKPNIDNLSKNHRKKFDHLVLGPAAGQGLHNRLQCQGLKALNKTHAQSSSGIPNFSDSVSFVTVFTIYNTSLSAHADVGMVTVGNTSYSKIERSMAVLDVFINFIQMSMPLSNIFILTDPASELPIQRNGVTILPIQGEYSRDRLMLQRIRSYIAFLNSKLDEISQRQGQIHHYIFTDSDIAVVDDLRYIFNSFPKFHLAVTFRNNKDQPLNSGFIAVRGTLEGVWRAKLFLQEVLEIYSSKYMKASRMLGDQLALAWVVKSHFSSDFKRFTRSQAFMDDIGGTLVLFLPCAIYNWTPPEGAGQFHGMPLDVKVVHFKGSRKRLMLEAWNFYNSEASISDMLCLILMSGRTKYDF